MLSTTDTEIMSAARGQGVVHLPDGHHLLEEVTQCHCGLLLVELPRPVTVARAHVATLTDMLRALTTIREIRYTHLARPDGTPACADCWEDPTRCEDHTPLACDQPDALLCEVCANPVAPGVDHCRACFCPEREGTTLPLTIP